MEFGNWSCPLPADHESLELCLNRNHEFLVLRGSYWAAWENGVVILFEHVDRDMLYLSMSFVLKMWVKMIEEHLIKDYWGELGQNRGLLRPNVMFSLSQKLLKPFWNAFWEPP